MLQMVQYYNSVSDSCVALCKLHTESKFCISLMCMCPSTNSASFFSMMMNFMHSTVGWQHLKVLQVYNLWLYLQQQLYNGWSPEVVMSAVTLVAGCGSSAFSNAGARHSKYSSRLSGAFISLSCWQAFDVFASNLQDRKQ